MPGRDGTGPYKNSMIGRRMNGCQRGADVRGRRNQYPYCRRFNDYYENEEIVLKNQAQFYEAELKDIKNRLDSLNSKTVSNESTDS